ncbi:uncharacterized protein UTRI_03162 [Ustilago trichophora]|uniref:Uncharacterized protein n=1 Tax=Ustilago trichophora TaxID=86804 RepID=A0A5C3E852_9BASI|nr:uncharacterized protein UTRI_03162 [Ustilago trichophora]
MLYSSRKSALAKPAGRDSVTARHLEISPSNHNKKTFTTQNNQGGFDVQCCLFWHNPETTLADLLQQVLKISRRRALLDRTKRHPPSATTGFRVHGSRVASLFWPRIPFRNHQTPHHHAVTPLRQYDTSLTPVSSRHSLHTKIAQLCARTHTSLCRWSWDPMCIRKTVIGQCMIFRDERCSSASGFRAERCMLYCTSTIEQLARPAANVAQESRCSIGSNGFTQSTQPSLHHPASLLILTSELKATSSRARGIHLLLIHTLHLCLPIDETACSGRQRRSTTNRLGMLFEAHSTNRYHRPMSVTETTMTLQLFKRSVHSKERGSGTSLALA